MLEIVVLIFVLGAYLDAARRRTGRKSSGWPFVVIGGAGFFATAFAAGVVVQSLGYEAVGPVVVLIGVLPWVWVGLTYLAIFVVLGGGKRAKSSWSCPGCMVVNESTTLVCGCGQSAPNT